MTATAKAADLPEGSVVVARFDPSDYVGNEHFGPDGAELVAYVRQDMPTVVGVFQWRAGHQAIGTSVVQKALDAGAVVLRHGYGDS